ncbi:hypothetical protein NDU88_011521 [Pleurodeles waltl]|uniref:Uncharacterized protein n=1 Tax=Pleurodeles waltl TaxID=8319 RepID=A0AAV7QZ02_PLEWA|nr:hypothetical protein NDU88_011521 [Pleurodeles waltl]
MGPAARPPGPAGGASVEGLRSLPVHGWMPGWPAAWGHPFRLIFRWQGKTQQLRSLREVYKLLWLEEPIEEHPQSPRPDQRRWRRARWQTALTGIAKPDSETIASERRAVLESLVGI